MKLLLHGHRYQTLFSWFRVQNKPYHCMITEQALPLYDPVHGSGPGEMVFRHMSVVLTDQWVHKRPEVIAPWPHMPNIQLVQGTEQVLPTALIQLAPVSG